MAEFIEPAELARLLDHQRDQLLIVDVREGDYTYGKIPGSIHMPRGTLNVADLVEYAVGKSTVIFHCYYSQTRGPSAAREFLEFLSTQSPSWRAVRVCVLEGGFKRWRLRYEGNPRYYEPL